MGGPGQVSAARVMPVRWYRLLSPIDCYRIASRSSSSSPPARSRGLSVAAVHELEAEPALDAQVAVRDLDIQRRGHLDDPIVLDVERERTAHAAVRTDRVGLRLPRLVPGAGLAQLVLAAEHQRPGRTDADAVAAIDARGIGQRDIGLGRDPGVEAPAGDRDREGVLGVGAAGLDALVAEDAFRVVANVQVIIDLDRLGDGLRGGPSGRMMMARLAGIAIVRRAPAASAARSAPGGRHTAPRTPGPAGPWRGPRTSRGTRAPSSATGGRAASRSGSPSRARPVGNRPGPGSASPRAPPRRRGRHSPG